MTVFRSRMIFYCLISVMESPLATWIFEMFAFERQSDKALFGQVVCKRLGG